MSYHSWGHYQGLDDHEKSRKVMEFENTFPGLENSWILGQVTEVMHGKNHGISIFGPNISRCFKTGSILLVIEQQYLIGPKNAGFSAGKL